MSKPILVVLLILIVGLALIYTKRRAIAEVQVDEHTQDRLRTDIYTGEKNWDEIVEICQDLAKDELYQDLITEEQVVPLADEFEKFARKVWEQKLLEEKNWPQVTDFDRLDRVFEKLLTMKVVALHNAGYTLSDGLGEVSVYAEEHPEGHFRAYCFYHGQDVEGALQSGSLFLAFGDLSSDDQTQKIEVAETVIKELKSEGFEPIWIGDPGQRIELPLKYQRRSP